MVRKSGWLALIFVLQPAFTLASPTQVADCRALVEVDAAIYLVDRDGHKVHRYGMPLAPKNPGSIVVSPDGLLVAYEAETGSRDERVVVADTRGGVRLLAPRFAEADEDSSHPLMSLRWDGPGLLQLERHVQPRQGLIQYWAVPDDGSALRKLVTGQEPSLGVRCAREPGRLREACMLGNLITVDGRDAYSRSGYDDFTPLQSLFIAEGGSVKLLTEPFIRIAVGRITDTVALLAEFPDGSRQQGRLADGEVLEVLSGENCCYGLRPRRERGGVRIDIMESDMLGGEDAIDPVIAWRRLGQIAIVESMQTQKWLTLLQSDPRSSRLRWRRVARGVLPIGDEAGELRFITPALAYLRTDTQALLLPLSIHGSASGATSIRVGPASSLPGSIEVKLQAGRPAVVAKVADWSCTQR